jgi:hypothetical protein
MITNYESFVNTPNLLELSEGVQAKLGIKQFANLFETSLFESKTDPMILEKAYSTYELGLLYENRKDWFGNDRQIYMLESEDQCILFKDNSLFVISQSTYKILNEQLSWDSVKSAWNSAGEKAKAAINSAAQASKDVYDAIGDGAKKVWELNKRIIITIVDFIKHDPLEAVAIFFQLMSAIIACIPAAGQVAGPICLGIAGMLDIIGGTMKIREAWKKFSGIPDVKGSGAIPAKSVASFSAGAPQLISGSVSILLGLNDVLSAPKAAIPGVGATSTAMKAASQRWAATATSQAVHSAEHFLAGPVSKAAAKLGPKLAKGAGEFMTHGGSGLAATAVSILMVKIGRGVLGDFFNTILSGISAITGGISFMLSLPTKAAEGIRKLIAAAESPIAKLLILPLEKIIEPLVSMLGKVLDTYVKPMVDGFKNYIGAIIENHKALEAYGKEEEIHGGEQVVKSATHQIKPKKLEVSKDDLSKIKQVKKEAKKNESLDHIQGFENFSLV